MKKHIQHKWVTWLTGTWNTSTVSSSKRTLHGTVLPFLRGEDMAGADAELIMSDECCKLTWVWFTVVKSVPATIYATLSVHPNFSRKLVHGTQIFLWKICKTDNTFTLYNQYTIKLVFYRLTICKCGRCCRLQPFCLSICQSHLRMMLKWLNV